MVIKPQIKLFFGLAAFLSSCATTNNWQEDDVYSMKEAAVPIDTDISDETDYSAYVYKKSLEDKKTIYSNNTSNNRIEPFAWRNIPMLATFYSFGSPWGMNSIYGPGVRWYISPFGDVVFLDYGFGPNYYNPYYGFGYPYSPFGYSNNYGGFGNYGPWAGNSTSSSIIKRPRGSIGGMGGVSSRPKNGTNQPVAAYSVVKPSADQTRKPIASTATIGRTSSGSLANTSRPNSSISRPASSTTTRTNSSSVSSPGRSTTSSGRVTNSSSRSSSGTSSSRAGSSSSSGRSSGNSSSGTKSPGRR